MIALTKAEREVKIMAEKYVRIDPQTGDMYTGEVILRNLVGLDGLLRRADIPTLAGGRSYRRGQQTLEKMQALKSESSDRKLQTQQWNNSLTKDDVQGF